MFLFTRKPPTSMKIDNVIYDIDMSFDNIILLYDVLNDKRMNDTTQISTCIKLLFGDSLNMSIDHSKDILVRVFKEYINFDEKDDTEYDIAGNPMPSNKSSDEKPISDLKEDSYYIYSSFMMDYKIDLFEERGVMHWWKFKSLLDGLSDNTKFKKVLEIRSMELPKDSKQREKVRKLKKMYAIDGSGD